MSEALTPSEPTTALAGFMTGIDEWLDSDEIAVLEARIETLLDGTHEMTAVPTPEAYGILTGAWKDIGALRKEVGEHFDLVKKPANDIHKRISSASSALESRLKAEENRLSRLASAFVAAQEAKRRADEQRMLEQQNAQEAKKREAAAAEASSPAEASAILSAPSTAPPPTVPRSDYVPADTGVGTRQSWKADVTDLLAFLDGICIDHAENNENKGQRIEMPVAVMGLRLIASGGITNTYLNTRARNSKGKWEFPGVRVYDASGLTTAKRGTRR